MNESLVSDRNPLLSILLIMLMVLIGFLFVGPAIGIAIASLFYEGNLLVDLQLAEPSSNIALPLLIVQGVTSLLGLVVIPLLYLKFIEHRSPAAFFKHETDWVKTLGMLIPLWLCFLVSISPIVEWNMHLKFTGSLEEFGKWARGLEDKALQMTNLITGFSSFSEFAFAIVVIGILPGIGEELVFRGLIQNELYRSSKNMHAAIWASAILFSAIHMQFFGFVPRMLLGAVFGYLYYWSGNLWVPMIAHFFHNSFTLTMLYLYKINLIDIDIDSQESAPLPFVAFSAMVTFALLYFIWKHYKRAQQSAW
jgi:hypothetical protein